MENITYEPFGNEWKSELKKWNKNSLIEFLRKTLIELQEMKNISSKQDISDNFTFTPENLLDNLEQLGAWSSFLVRCCYAFGRLFKNEI